MNRIHLVFALILAMWLVLGATLFVPTYPKPRGQPHPTHKEMAQGGSGLERHGRLVWFGWALGSLALLLFVSTLSLGVHLDRLAKLRKALYVGIIVELTIFAGVVLTYRQWIDTSHVDFLGPFPTPTSLMVFGMWGMGAYYVLLYIVMFSRWFWTPEDAAKFQSILQQYKSEETAN